MGHVSVQAGLCVETAVTFCCDRNRRNPTSVGAAGRRAEGRGRGGTALGQGQMMGAESMSGIQGRGQTEHNLSRSLSHQIDDATLSNATCMPSLQLRWRYLSRREARGLLALPATRPVVGQCGAIAAGHDQRDAL